MKLLMHICCGPCASYPLPFLMEEGHQVKGFFFNPNIHPFKEYERRREGANQLVRHHGIELAADEDYDPNPYLRAVVNHEDERCGLCYRIRLDKTAQLASREGFEGFTSSLLVSPYQKHDQIKAVGEDCADKYGIPFLYYDWRDKYHDTIKRSKELDLYRQPYCGCIYSEWDRYKKK